MIPNQVEYYKRRAREHRALAATSTVADRQAQHQQLVLAYTVLARRYRLRQRLVLTA